MSLDNCPKLKYIYICFFTICIFHRIQVVLSSRIEWEKEREPLRVVPFNSKNFITICFPHDRWKSYAAFLEISKWRILLVFLADYFELDLIKLLINFSERWIIQHDKTYFNSYFLFFYFFFCFFNVEILKNNNDFKWNFSNRSNSF